MKSQGLWAGMVGSAVSLCCAGTAVLLSFLSGLGLGFLINDVILFPVLFLSFGVVLYSLHTNKKDHGKQKPFYVALGSMVLILMGIFYPLIIWLGIIGLISTTVWDYKLGKRCIKNGKGTR